MEGNTHTDSKQFLLALRTLSQYYNLETNTIDREVLAEKIINDDHYYEKISKDYWTILILQKESLCHTMKRSIIYR